MKSITANTKVSIGLLIILIGSVFSYALVAAQASQAQAEVREAKTEIRVLKDALADIKSDVDVIKNDVGWIKRHMEREAR